MSLCDLLRSPPRFLVVAVTWFMPSIFCYSELRVKLISESRN